MVRDRKSNTLVIVSYLTFALTLSVVGWLLWSLFWPFQVLEAQSDSFKVQNPGKIVQPGEYVYTSFNVCKKMDLVKDISTTIVGDVLIGLPPSQSDLPIGCYHKTIDVARIPNIFPSGWYSIRVTYSYKINSLRTVVYHFETDKFFVPSISKENLPAE